jgi:hypothetical protein
MRGLFKLGFGVVPLAMYFIGIQAIGACAISGTSPAPTTSAKGKTLDPPAPESCPDGQTETKQDGKTWCCDGEASCNSLGAPRYHAPCPEAGLERVGTTYSFTSALTFKPEERWRSVAYQCRSEDGVEPRWEYVEPARFCTHVVQREWSRESGNARIVTDTTQGDLCE